MQDRERFTMNTAGMSDAETGSASNALRMMRAVIMQDFGVTPSVMDVPMPDVGSDEVRVRVLVASINGFDLAMAAGYFQGIFEYHLPAVLGKDFAGIVDAVGDAVTRFAVGDKVFGVVMKAFLHDGSFGEYVTVAEDSTIAHMPEGLDMVEAGVLSLAGTAALMGIEALAPVAGETMLISGAPGGVGAYATQMAAARGVEVIATVGSADADFVHSMGATHTVERGENMAAAVRALYPDGIDMVLHLAGDALQQSELLVSGGRIASALGLSPELVGDRQIQVTNIYSQPNAERLTYLAGEVAAGRLRVHIDRSFTLEEAPIAMAGFNSGKHGKIVIRLD